MSKIDDFPCKVDGCDEDAADLVFADDGTWEVGVTLCADHYTALSGIEWTPDTVHGRILMQDTCGEWFFLPEKTP